MTPFHGARGYTLIEILAAFFLMTILLTLVASVFAENGRQRQASLGLMRESLSAAAVLDQLAQDFEGALFLANKADRRPDENPWRFFAEGLSDSGAMSVRFVTQNAPAANVAQHASGWVEVAYFLEEDDAGEQVLWRWLSPRPPSEPTRGFPDSNDERSIRMAVGVNEFGIRFLDPEGDWVDEWDSAYQSSEVPLPVAVEINLRLMREARAGESKDQAETVPGAPHKRRVALGMPTLDVQALIALGQEGDEEGPDCFTIAQCQAEGDSAWYDDALDTDCGGDDRLCELLTNASTTCWSEIEREYPALAARAPESCQP